jgi:formate dehydrogenase iron-sulfur subunit
MYRLRCLHGSLCVRVPYVLADDVTTYGTNKPIQKDKSYKCHACLNNPREVPACANTCPTGALTYGKRDDLVNKAQERLKAVKGQYPKASIYGLKEFGGLNVITILKDAPEKYGLPVDVKPVETSKIKKIHDMYAFFSAITPGIPALKRIAYRISKNLS